MLYGRALLFTTGVLPRRGACRVKASRSEGSSSGNSKVTGREALLKGAVVSGSLSLLGDVLAQILQQKNSSRKESLRFDLARMARMAGFGLFFYGPYQCKWYAALDKRWPSVGWPNFLTKVTLNQIALSPVVLVVVFSWNLALTGQSQKIGRKLKLDLFPTMINGNWSEILSDHAGWKVWVPAASLNFALVPLQHQVLYMSICSVLWTAYLSHASNLSGN